jgi:hypothetical protein
VQPHHRGDHGGVRGRASDQGGARLLHTSTGWCSTATGRRSSAGWRNRTRG